MFYMLSISRDPDYVPTQKLGYVTSSLVQTTAVDRYIQDNEKAAREQFTGNYELSWLKIRKVLRNIF